MARRQSDSAPIPVPRTSPGRRCFRGSVQTRYSSGLCGPRLPPTPPREGSRPPPYHRGFGGGTGAHGRALAVTYFLQTGALRCASRVRACPRVPSLLYPSRTRDLLSVCETSNTCRSDRVRTTSVARGRVRQRIRSQSLGCRTSCARSRAVSCATLARISWGTSGLIPTSATASSTSPSSTRQAVADSDRSECPRLESPPLRQPSLDTRRSGRSVALAPLVRRSELKRHSRITRAGRRDLACRPAAFCRFLSRARTASLRGRRTPAVRQTARALHTGSRPRRVWPRR